MKKRGVAGRPRGSAKDRALRLLSVRWRSRAELARRLRQAGFEPEEVEAALESLELGGLIDDARFAREMVRGMTGRRLAGDRGILASLAQKGVARDVADQAVTEAGDETERALELARRRAPRMAGLEPEVAFRRLYGLLVRRGFGPRLAAEACRTALQGPGSPPEGPLEPPEG